MTTLKTAAKETRQLHACLSLLFYDLVDRQLVWPLTIERVSTSEPFRALVTVDEIVNKDSDKLSIELTQVTQSEYNPVLLKWSVKYSIQFQPAYGAVLSSESTFGEKVHFFPRSSATWDGK